MSNGRQLDHTTFLFAYAISERTANVFLTSPIFLCPSPRLPGDFAHATGLKLRTGQRAQGEYILEIDHIIPTALGGKDDLSNKWVYHRHCHDEKTAEDLARIAKLQVTGNGHAQFWIGGGGSNPVADHTHP